MSETAIQKLGIVGAGQMGAGIAQVAAERGVAVVLVDRDDETAQKGKAKIAAQLGKLVEKGKLAAEKRDAAVALIATSGSYEALAECDFIVEAATENQELKQKIFEKIDAAAKPGAVLATNTSSISITLLASKTKRPEQVIHPLEGRGNEIGLRCRPAHDRSASGDCQTCQRPQLRRLAAPVGRSEPGRRCRHVRLQRATSLKSKHPVACSWHHLSM